MMGYCIHLDLSQELPGGDFRNSLSKLYDDAWQIASDVMNTDGDQVDINVNSSATSTNYIKARFEDNGEAYNFIDISLEDASMYLNKNRFRSRQLVIMDSPGEIYLMERLIHESIHALCDQKISDLNSYDESVAEGIAQAGSYIGLVKYYNYGDRQEVYNYVSNWVAHHLIAANMMGLLEKYSVDEIKLPDDLDLPEFNLNFIQKQLDWARKYQGILKKINGDYLRKFRTYTEGFLRVVDEMNHGKSLRDIAMQPGGMPDE